MTSRTTRQNFTAVMTCNSPPQSTQNKSNHKPNDNDPTRIYYNLRAQNCGAAHRSQREQAMQRDTDTLRMHRTGSSKNINSDIRRSVKDKRIKQPLNIYRHDFHSYNLHFRVARSCPEGRKFNQITPRNEKR